MNILHISTTDKSGGAAIAVFRLNKAMQQYGINSKMLVLRKKSIENSIISVSDYKKKNKFKYLFLTILNQILDKYFWKATYLFSFANWGIRISQRKELRDADIIYIHWINDNFISIKELNRILRLNKPVFLFMHDMWNITGGCHYSLDCKKYEIGCKKCPQLKRQIPDIAGYVYKRKEKLLKNKRNLHFITPSNWLGNCVSQSCLFSNNKVEVIPNVLDANIFKKIDCEVARSVLNLPQDKKLVLFGAYGGTSNPYKGWMYLKEALKNLAIKDLELVVFGNNLSDNEIKEIPYPIHSIGRMYDEASLALLYNAVDVFVVPSLMDNYPNTILESLFCKTPVVAFNIGGIPDLVQHRETGYLAEYKNIQDLVLGLEWTLEHSNNELFISKLAKFVDNKLLPETVLCKHLNLLKKHDIST